MYIKNWIFKKLSHLKKYFIYSFLLIFFFIASEINAVKTNEMITQQDLLNAGALEDCALKEFLDYSGVDDILKFDPDPIVQKEQFRTFFLSHQKAGPERFSHADIEKFGHMVGELMWRLHVGESHIQTLELTKGRKKYPCHHDSSTGYTNGTCCKISGAEIVLGSGQDIWLDGEHAGKRKIIIFNPTKGCKIQSQRGWDRRKVEEEIKESLISQDIYDALCHFMSSFERLNASSFGHCYETEYFLLQQSNQAQTIYVDVQHEVLAIFPTTKSTLSRQLRPLPNGHYIYFDIKHNCEDERLNGRYLKAEIINPFENTRLEIFPLANQNVDLEDFPIIMFEGFLTPISDSPDTPLMKQPRFLNGITLKEVDLGERSPYMQSLISLYGQINFKAFDLTHSISRWIETDIGPIMAHFFFASARTFERFSDYPTVIDLHGGPEDFETAFLDKEDQVEGCHRITLAYPGTIGFEDNFRRMIYQNPHYIKPCLQALKGLRSYLDILPFINPTKLVLRGASMGGFITGHAAQDPDLAERFSQFISIIPMLMPGEHEGFHDSRGIHEKEIYSQYSLDRGLSRIKRPWTIIAGEEDKIVPIDKHIRPIQTALQKLSEREEHLSALIKIRIIPNLDHRLPKGACVKKGFYEEGDHI